MEDIQNAIALQEYVKHNNSPEINKIRVPLRGESKWFPTYDIPLSYLYFNIDNGRFKAEYDKHVKNENAGKALDPTNPQDANTLQTILLKLDLSKTEETKNDIKEKGQLEAGLVTNDGRVIDGNRRLAILKDLSKDNSKYDSMRVVILPPDTRTKELSKLELSIQFGTNERLSYGWINELLKLREVREQQIPDKEIAKILYNKSDEKEMKKLEKSLEMLSLVDEYLEFISCRGEYTKVHNKLQHFEDIQVNIRAFEKNGVDENQAIIYKKAMWQLIHHKVVEVKEMRNLKKMIAGSATKALTLMEQIGNLPRPSSDEQKDAVDTLIKDNWDGAKEELSIKEREDSPMMTLKKIRQNMEGLKLDHISQKDEYESIIDDIIGHTNELRKWINS